MATTAGDVVHECVVGELKEANRTMTLAAAALQEQSPATEHTVALYVPWLFTWRLKGHSRGEMLYALVLAPGEEVAIEASIWDRDKEFSAARGNASALMEDIGDSLRVPNAGFDIQGTDGMDARASLNSSSATSLELMIESVQRSSMKLRLDRQTEIKVSEIGAEQQTTSLIRNSELGNTLFVDYYEVLAHYEFEIALKADEVRLCALADKELPLPLDLDADARLRGLFDDLITRNKELLSLRSTEEVVLPTAGVHMESRLGG